VCGRLAAGLARISHTPCGLRCCVTPAVSPPTIVRDAITDATRIVSNGEHHEGR